MARSTATRARTRRVLADLNRHLTEAIAALDAEPGSDGGGVREVVERLTAAREAVALLALERAAPAQAPEYETAPALERRLELEPDRAAAQRSRVFVRRMLQEWALPELAVNAAVDVTSELVTNAVRAAPSHLVVSLTRRPQSLLVSVWDDAEGRPHLRAYRPGVSQRGIGLRLVKHLSQDWGWDDEGAGKWVWARLLLPRSDAAGG